MSDNDRDPIDDAIVKFGWWLIGTVFAFLVALIIGILHKKQKERDAPAFPDSLEVDEATYARLQLAQHPWSIRNARWFLPLLALLTVIWVVYGLGNLRGYTFPGAAMSLVSGVIAGVWFFRLRKAYQTYEQAKAQPTAPIKPLNRQTAHQYIITLPRGTEWQPHDAAHFMEQILHKFGKLTFQIVATPAQITWRILDLRLDLEPSVVKQAVHAFYPSAQVDDSPLADPVWGEPFYRITMAFQQATDFIAPIAYAEDLRDFDPLINLSQEMNGLRPGERITYSLIVTDPAGFVYDQAKNLLTVKPGANPFKYLSSEGWAEAGYTLAAGEETRLTRFDPKDQAVIETKLGNLCFQALLLIEIDAPTAKRVRELSAIDSHIIQFRKFPYNALFTLEDLWPSGSGAQDSIVHIESLQRGQTLDTLGLLNSWLTNASQEWQDCRLILDTRELAALWHLPNQRFTASNIAWTRGRQVQMPNVMRGRQEGVCLGINRFAGNEEPVHLLDEDRASHMLVIGKTGVGKSTLMHHLIHADIAAGKGVAVIDPHGKLVSDILQSSIPAEREDDVVVLDVSTKIDGVFYPPPLNILAKPTGVARDIAVGQLMAVLEKVFAADFSATEMAHTLSMALMVLSAEPHPTVEDIERVFDDLAYREALLSTLQNDRIQRFWERFEARGSGRKAEMVYPVLRRLSDFYKNDVLYSISCHPDNLNLEGLIAQNKIILVSLQANEAQVQATGRTLLGAVLLSHIQMAAMAGEIGKGTFHLYVDETQNLITSSLPIILSEARKSGLVLTLVNQYLKQLAGDTLDAVMGTVGTMILFEIGDPDARAVASYVKPNFDVTDLTNLGKYRATAHLRYQGERQPAFTVETLPPPTPETATAGQEREMYLRRKSRDRYTPQSHAEVLSWLSAHTAQTIAPVSRAAGDQSDYSDPV